MQTKSSEDEKFQTWLAKTWRPLMAYTYIAICVFDFVIAPIIWTMFQTSQGIPPKEQWTPLTLQGAGLFHAAMGAILGVTAWGRSKEKLAFMEYSTPQVSYDPNKYRNTTSRGVVYGREE